jgi:hypothetical protein
LVEDDGGTKTKKEREEHKNTKIGKYTQTKKRNV